MHTVKEKSLQRLIQIDVKIMTFFVPMYVMKKTKLSKLNGKHIPH